MNPSTFAIRDQSQHQAIIFLHGFSGESHSTFGMMPAFLAGNPALYGWDIHCFGYPTALRPDITGVWSADPDLTTLAGFLTTALRELTFKRYRRVALVGHSMGGLIIQRALADAAIPSSISHVVLFGTPSDGLKKSNLAQIFKRQVRDTIRGGPFIAQLRADWKARVGDRPPFIFRAVAGIRDEFVPRASSVDVFEPEYRSFISGNHLDMVKPQLPGADSIELLLNLFTNGSATEPAFVKDRRRRADKLRSERNNLAEKQIEELIYALEEVGEDGEAIDALACIANRSINLTGVLAGRLKRRWLADPDVNAADGLHSQELYGEAYAKAAAAGDHEQAFYNGINDAFLTLALGKDYVRAQAISAQVLSHASRANGAPWARAARGEACIYLGDPAAALSAYAEAVKQDWTPRELESMRRQAVWAARLMGDPVNEARLDAVFEPHRS